MSQNSLVLPTTGTVSGLQMTQAANNALDTLNTLASGASAPSSPEAGQFWHDTANSLVRLRSLDNTAWIPFLQLNEAAYAALPYFPGQITGDMNRIINSGMDIDQVNGGASYSVLNNNTPVYTADQWIVACGSGTAGGLTAQRVSDAPTGLASSLKVTVGTGAGSVGSTDFLYACQPIEGGNLSDLGYGTPSAQPLSLSFWVKSSVAGNFAAVLQNAAGTRAVVNKFTIATAGVWQQVAIANIPGDQTGTYTPGTGAMLNLLVVIATGAADQTGTLNSWQAGDWLGSTVHTNGVLTTSGATFQITGVMLSPGVFCLPYQKRSVQQELMLAQRYLFCLQASVNTIIGFGWASSANSVEIGVPFPVPMRSVPTFIGPATVSHVQANFQSATAIVASSGDVSSAVMGTIQIAVASGISANSAAAARWQSTAVTDSVTFSARM